MEDFQSQEGLGDKNVLKQETSQNLSQYGHSGSHYRTFRTGAKASYLPVPSSAATSILFEMNYLRNHSAIIKATVAARAELANKQASQLQVKLQMKQHKISMDRLQSQIETLRVEKAKLQTIKVSLEENCNMCQPGWSFIKSSCYYFSSRHESNSKKNWLDSRADCVSKGGELLVINNLEEQQLLSEMLQTQRSGLGEWWERGYWIGLTDVVNKGTWVWVNNVTEVESMQSVLVLSAKMEDGRNLGGGFSKLISEDELSADENTLYSNQEKQQVSMSMVGPESSLNHYKLLALSLAVLAVILLAVDIGLGVYYYKLTDGLYLVTDFNSELAKLHVSYNTAVQRRDEAKKELARVIDEAKITKWEMEHLNRRCQSYEKEADTIRLNIAGLKSHLPMMKEGCRHCIAGWTFVNSMCYYFAFSSGTVRKSWQEARDFCRKYGSDLAVINSREEHLAVSGLIKNYHESSGNIYHDGFWIGLTDVDEEGTWKWLDGTRLTDSYWNTGEPNNQGNEDCAATYPRDNPFFAWNDAPCNFKLKWVCEMAPRLSN
ncbi:uncharacterized protein LOC117806483 [Notolabrus celidotus]|uniref:uncharacterized protein LOC117806483 n=1 Tax=Notolabrus celidotus TaxID=1203425 RepID=UPI0014902B48|nr:uncharacterized protein LOC117806483 [Notolabrus celidotus]